MRNTLLSNSYSQSDGAADQRTSAHHYHYMKNRETCSTLQIAHIELGGIELGDVGADALRMSSE